MPQWGVLQVMSLKLVLLALVAGLVARRFKTVNLPLIIGVVLVSLLLGGIGEFLLTGSIQATIADFVIGWPGLLLQIFGSWILLKYLC